MKHKSVETIYEHAGRTYHIWDQHRLGDPYLSVHGCSFCALASLINAWADPSVTPLSLRQNSSALLGGSRQVRYSRMQLALQRKPMFDLLGWQNRMPLNIAGAVRIMECYMDVDYLDGGSDDEIRSFVLAKAGSSIPVIATGRYIPSIGAGDLCPHATHSFLILGLKDASTLIVSDSAGAEDERIKYVHIDDLVRGIYRTGIRRGLGSRQYYFSFGTMGGLAAPARR